MKADRVKVCFLDGVTQCQKPSCQECIKQEIDWNKKWLEEYELEKVS